MTYLFILILLFSNLFSPSGWVTIDLNNKEKEFVQFYLPKRYYSNTTDTDGHGIIIGYDLIESDTHIIFSKVSGITIEIDDWSYSSENTKSEKVVRKGIRNELFWRYDKYFSETGDNCFTLYGYGRDSLEINEILDSVCISQYERSCCSETCIRH